MYSTKGSIGLRFLANILDGFFQGIIVAIVFFLFTAVGSSVFSASGGDIGLLSLISLPFLILLFFSSFFYYGICEGSALHATFGKKLCGLIIVDINGKPVGMGRAFLRSFFRPFSWVFFGIGLFIALFDEKRGRALHDLIAGTYVADAKSASSYNQQPSHQPPVQQVQKPIAQPVQQQAAKQVQQVPTIPVQTNEAQNYAQSSTSALKASVVGVSGNFAGKVLPVSESGIIIGRDSLTCDYAFPNNASGISRQHCKVQFNNQTKMFVIYDMGSSYGTFLANGVKIRQGTPATIAANDSFYLATSNNTFRVVIE